MCGEQAKNMSRKKATGVALSRAGEKNARGLMGKYTSSTIVIANRHIYRRAYAVIWMARGPTEIQLDMECDGGVQVRGDNTANASTPSGHSYGPWLVGRLCDVECGVHARFNPSHLFIVVV